MPSSTTKPTPFLVQLQRASLKAKHSSSSARQTSSVSSSSTKALERFVGKSAFRVVSNVLLSATLRSPETISISCTREPFDCFLSTFRLRSLMEQFGGRYPADAASFIVAFLRSFDESVEGTRNLITVLGDSTIKRTEDDENDLGNNNANPASSSIRSNNTTNSSVMMIRRGSNTSSNMETNGSTTTTITTTSIPTMKIRVTVVWSPKSATNMFSNAISFDCSLVKVEPQAVSSFSWTLVNDLHSSVVNLAKIANRSLVMKINGTNNDEDEDDAAASPERQERMSTVAGVAIQGLDTPVLQVGGAGVEKSPRSGSSAVNGTK